MPPTCSIDRPPLIPTAGVVLLAMLLGATSIAAAEPPSGLSIRIDDGETEVEAGRDLVYTSELTNAGQRTVEAVVVLTAPAYVTVSPTAGGGDVDGRIEGADISWPVSVEPGATVTLVADAHIGSIPAEARRVTTLVSVHLGEGAAEDRGAPIIRSADSNRIVGIDDSGTRTDVPTAREANGPVPVALFVALGACVVLLGSVAAFVLRRRRVRSR